MELKNAEFLNLKLAEIYEDFNQFSEDEDFWLKIIQSLDVSYITDFGCGTGLFTYKINKLGYNVKGIELARPMLEIAQSKKNADQIDWIQGSFEKLQGFQTDLILMTSHVAQFIVNTEDWRQLLQNSYNILKKGGYILFDSKNPVSKPWNNYTKEKYNRTENTKFGYVNMQIQTIEVFGNIATHEIEYSFCDTGEILKSVNTLIYRSKEEIEQNITQGGFTVKKVYGDWDFGDYTIESREMIFLAQKK